MKDFPVTAEQFYASRDDRTNRCGVDSGYQRTKCVVYLAPLAALTAAGQTMLLASCNLLSRWCRDVTIIMPTVRTSAELDEDVSDLGDFILSQMRDADPFGTFRVAETASDEAAISLYVGYQSHDEIKASGIFINASGWLAAIDTRPINLPEGNDRNYLGAIAAACLGVAQMFKCAIGMQQGNYIRSGVFDVFRLNWADDVAQTSWPDNLAIGNLLMVGAGSVGSSAAYCMRLAGIVGTITIVDRDIVKVENFNRSPIFGRRSYGDSKAQAVADFLAHSKLNASFEVSWWDDFLNAHPRATFDFDIWFPLANEFGVRRAMQANVPPLMIHASTTANWGVNHGRHIPGRDDCLVDRFRTEVQPSDLTCATVSTSTSSGQDIDAALPFASLFAGLLITADLVRLQLDGYPQLPNFALFDWYSPIDRIQAWDHVAREGCICQEQGVGFHDKFNAGTRYRHLSSF